MARAVQAPRVRKQPQRTCVACRQTEGKRTLLRIVRTPKGQIEIDPTGKKSGRGAYVHTTFECIDRILSTGGLSRALKTEVGADLKAQLRSLAVRTEQPDEPAPGEQEI